MVDLNQIYAHIDAHFDAHIEDMRRFLRKPGISLTGEGMRESTEMLLYLFRDLGASEAHLVEFEDGWPLVYAEFWSKDPQAKTLLNYGMWDVMPVRPEPWRVPPFDAEIIPAQDIGLNPDWGPVLVCRGAYNQRGPLLASLNALKSIMEVTGDIPVNLIFTVENEEEMDSPHLVEFRDRYMDSLRQADAVHYHRMIQSPERKHVIFLGFKGTVTLELSVEGGEWGGPIAKPANSVDDAWVDAPAWRLVWALSTLKAPNGRVQIEGFYDEVRPPTDEELDLIEKIYLTTDVEQLKKKLHIERFKGGAPWDTTLLRDYLLAPVLNIDGYESGYTGEGVLTNLPHQALGKMDVRLVPNMSMDQVVPRLRRHLDRHGFPEVKINKVPGGYDWYRTPLSEDIIRAIISATVKHGVEPEVWPSAPQSFPGAVYAKPPLALPIGTSGLGRGGWPHSANEYITVEGIRDHEKYTVTLLYEYARL